LFASPNVKILRSVRFHDVLSVYQNLCCLINSFKSLHSAQFALQQLFTLASIQLLKANSGIGSILSQIVEKHRSVYPSFASDNDVGGKREALTLEQRHIYECNFISDLLFVLLSDYFRDERASESKVGVKPTSYLIASTPNNRISTDKHTEFLRNNLRQACDAAGRAFQFDMNGCNNPIINTVSSLFLAFISFWKWSLIQLQKEKLITNHDEYLRIETNIEHINIQSVILYSQNIINAIDEKFNSNNLYEVEVYIGTMIGIFVPSDKESLSMLSCQQTISRDIIKYAWWENTNSPTSIPQLQRLDTKSVRRMNDTWNLNHVIDGGDQSLPPTEVTTQTTTSMMKTLSDYNAYIFERLEKRKKIVKLSLRLLRAAQDYSNKREQSGISIDEIWQHFTTQKKSLLDEIHRNNNNNEVLILLLLYLHIYIYIHLYTTISFT
jgi:hypothetical protein